MLLGDPASALRTIEWLEGFDVSIFNGDEIRALAHLALGDAIEAEALIRAHAERALTGRMIGEVCDSALLLAAYAEAEGSQDVARRLLLQMGIGKEAATVIYSEHLAARLGISVQYAERQRIALTYDTSSVEGPAAPAWPRPLFATSSAAEAGHDRPDVSHAGRHARRLELGR